jgi:hypothetical protein
VTAAKLALALKPSGSAATTDEAVRALGTAAGTAAAGNDSRITGALQQSLVDVKGDLIVGTAPDTAARLGVGTDAQVLTADSAQTTGVRWATAPAAGIQPTLFDAKGDLIAASAADTPARLPVGSNGQVLTADSAQAAGLAWAAQTGIQSTLFDAKGDIIAASAADTAARLPVGSNDQILVADSAQATGVKWGALVDSRMPVAGEKSALAGTSGTPGSGNKYVTDADPRLALALAAKTSNYVLAIGDANQGVETNLGTALTVTVPPNSSVAFPIGTTILVIRLGAGTATIVAGGGVTIHSAGGVLTLRAQYSTATLLKRGTDEWYLFGDIG